MKKALALLIVGISVSGCNFSINGNEFQKIGSTYKYISGPSLSKAGLTESWGNCLPAAFDPMNRGSRCN